jgi:hypothetical protein
MNGGGHGGRAADAERPREIEREIESIREDLDGLVGELDRRRHEALDWRLQARRHRRQLWIAAGVVGVAVLGLALLRSRRQQSRLASGRELLHALHVVATNPEGLTRAVEERSTGSKLAAGTAKVASVALPIIARNLLREDRAATR